MKNLKKIADFSDFLPFCRKRLFVYVGASVLLMKCFQINFSQFTKNAKNEALHLLLKCFKDGNSVYFTLKGCVILLKLFRHCFGEIFEERKQEILQIWTLKFEIRDKREIKG